MTEIEAESAWCPKAKMGEPRLFADNRESVRHDRCIGRRCMWWRWSEEQETQATRATEAPPGPGWEKTGTVLLSGAGFAPQGTPGVNWALRHGFCGVAGQP